MSDERDFSVGDKKFKLSKIDALKQFHIVRRLGPILGDIIPIAQSIRRVKLTDMNEEDQFSLTSKLIAPFMVGISKLSDADAQLVLLGLCSAVEIYQPEYNTWGKVAGSETLSFSNLGLPLLLRIAAQSFMYNLSDFFALAPQVSHGGK